MFSLMHIYGSFTIALYCLDTAQGNGHNQVLEDYRHTNSTTEGPYNEHYDVVVILLLLLVVGLITPACVSTCYLCVTSKWHKRCPQPPPPTEEIPEERFDEEAQIGQALHDYVSTESLTNLRQEALKRLSRSCDIYDQPVGIGQFMLDRDQQVEDANHSDGYFSPMCLMQPKLPKWTENVDENVHDWEAGQTSPDAYDSYFKPVLTTFV